MIRFLSRAALLVLLAPVGAMAQSLNASDAAVLETRLDAYADAIQRKDAEAVFQFLPPPIRQTMAAELGLNVPAAEDAFVNMMDVALDGVSITHVDVVADKTSLGKTPAGRSYTFVSSLTRAVFSDGAVFEDVEHAIALNDDETWYLVTIDTPRQIQFLTTAYPEFEDIPFP